MRFHVDNMTCDGCARSVTRTILRLDSAAEVSVDLDAKSVEVRSSIAAQDVVAALAKAGYPVAAA